MRHLGQERHVPPDTSGPASLRLAQLPGSPPPARNVERRNRLLDPLIRVELRGDAGRPVRPAPSRRRSLDTCGLSAGPIIWNRRKSLRRTLSPASVRSNPRAAQRPPTAPANSQRSPLMKGGTGRSSGTAQQRSPISLCRKRLKRGSNVLAGLITI